MLIRMSGFLHVDTKGISKSFGELMAHVKKGAEVFHTEGDGTEVEVVEPNFKEFLNGSAVLLLPTAVETANDALKSGAYGDGVWNDDFNSYTVGASDSISLLPSAGYVFELSIALAEKAAVTKIILPNETYTETSENAVVTLTRVQTPPLSDAAGKDLGVYTLTVSTHLETVGDLLATRGCSNDKATNYSDKAVIDDGSCILPEWYEKIPTWTYAVGGLGVIALMMVKR